MAKRMIAAAVGAVAATSLLACAANASTGSQPWTSEPLGTAVTHIYDNGTVPGVRGTWASDWITRTATVRGGIPVAPSRCGQPFGPCYAYTVVVRDQGWFRAIRGALTPNQVLPGRRIASTVTGRVSSYAPFSFYATATPNPGLVPATARNAPYTTTWPELFFPAGTAFGGLTGIPSTVGYSAGTPCGFQHWTSASSNGYGDLAQDGNITGCRP